MSKIARPPFNRFSGIPLKYNLIDFFTFFWERNLRIPVARIQQFFPVTVLPVIVGVLIALLSIRALNSTSKWAAIIVLLVVTPTFILVIKDIKKIILIALVVDLGLGIDIALQNQGWHDGGPTGYMISLMTPCLVIGYVIWIANRSPKPRYFCQLPYRSFSFCSLQLPLSIKPNTYS